MLQVARDTTIGELIFKAPETATLLTEVGMHCLG